MFGQVEQLRLGPLLAGDLMVLPDSGGMEPEVAAMLWRATAMAIEGVRRFGGDFPVGAIATSGGVIAGAAHASDNRTDFPDLHAEQYSVMRSLRTPYRPDTCAVNIEPCRKCIPFLAEYHGASEVGSVYFVLERAAAEERGLVNERPGLLDEGQYEDAKKKIKFEQAQNPLLRDVNLALLDCVKRAPGNDELTIDRDLARERLLAFPNIHSAGFAYNTQLPTGEWVDSGIVDLSDEGRAQQEARDHEELRILRRMADAQGLDTSHIDEML